MSLEDLGLSADERSIWEAWQSGLLLLRACGSCSTVCHPPLPMCSHCGSVSWRMMPPPTRGQLHAWISVADNSVVHRAPRVIVLVELTDGVRLVTNLTDCNQAEVHTGMPVELYLGELDDLTVPLCRPMKQTSSQSAPRA